MSKRTLDLTNELYEYLLAQSMRESAPLQALREETAKLENNRMQISPDQGQLMALLARLIDAKKTLEIGTYTGYSALAVAEVLPDGGKVVACDISEEWTNIGKKYWQQAGQSQKIELYLAPALQTLQSLCEQDQNESFDFAFIDADKQNQSNYFEYCLKLVRPGGLILIDNVLWGGSVIDQSDQSEDTVAIRQFNQNLLHDDRVFINMIAVGDGITLAMKKPNHG